MSLSNHNRQNVKQGVIVLNRLCTKNNITVMGGASKLFKACKEWAKQKGYTKIISFADLRWSEGNIYRNLDFTLEKTLSPDYFYVKNGMRYSKQSLKKTAAERLISKTELELRSEQGYYRIYDCGKQRWVYAL